jgi:deazaflavin-dependent oxidoreductase (nitroreductase family)
MQMHPVLAGAVRAMSRLHTQLFRLLGGRGFMNNNTLILTTRGRKTGRQVAIPLLHVADGNRLYVVASFGGNDRPPNWYLNLAADPEVRVEVGGRAGRYRARAVSEAEKAAVWPRLLAIYPAYASYQQRTRRVIPVVELAPIQS